MSKRRSSVNISQRKLEASKGITNYLYRLLNQCGLTVKEAPNNHIATEDSVCIIRNLKRNIKAHSNYPDIVNELFKCIETECEDEAAFKHYLYPNIIKSVDDASEGHPMNESVMRILLNIPLLQEKLTNFIFDKATDFAVDFNCEPWIKMILKCFIALDYSPMNVLSSNLINLLDVTTERIVRLEIILAIPHILRDEQHEKVATELSKFISEDDELIPAVLECLSYLTLSDEQYAELQRQTLRMLTTVKNFSCFPNYVKFLLIPDRADEAEYVEVIQGLRDIIDWPDTTDTKEMRDVANSQILTAIAIRNSMMSSKVITLAWIKELSSCKISLDHKPLDVIILLLMYTTSEENQNVVNRFIRKQIKLDILKEDLVKKSFCKYKPILKEYLNPLLELTSSLLISQMDPIVENFISHIYILIFTELEGSCRTVVTQLLQLGLNRKQYLTNILHILNKFGEIDMSMLKPQSMLMMTLLDRMDDLNLNEKRDVMNLVCGLAYSFYNSIIRDDVHIIIRKQLGSSNPTVKIQGILAGVYAIKYLMKCRDEHNPPATDESNNQESIINLPEGDVKEATEIIELISRSTRQFPDLIVFYYDELCNVITSAPYVNSYFISWLTRTMTHDLTNNFIIYDEITNDKIGQIKLSLQYLLNTEHEIDGIVAVNIAGLVLEPRNNVDIVILPALFQLVQTLLSKQNDDNLRDIDALLGCAIIMPKFTLDLIDEMDLQSIHKILDCLIHCVNWFRELVNGFATVQDPDLRSTIIKRILQIEEMEMLIMQVFLKTSGPYKPPYCFFDMNKYNRETSGTTVQARMQIQTQMSNKKSIDDESILASTHRTSPPTQNNSFKPKGDIAHNFHFRALGLKLVNLFNNNLNTDNNPENEVNIKVFKFLLKCVNDKLKNTIISKMKKKTFLTKAETIIYDHEKAEECAKNIYNVIPKLMSHMKYICEYLDKYDNGSQCDDNSQEHYDYLTCLEYLYTLLAIYFNWIGFKNHNNALLKNSLIAITNNDPNKIPLLKDLFVDVLNFFQKFETYCTVMSTAIPLLDLLKAIQELSGNGALHKILRDVSSNFLSKQWNTLDGILEKGLFFNQSVDRITSLFFMNSDILDLKHQTEALRGEVRHLKGRYDPLPSFKCFNKGNFPILYRNIGVAVRDAAKNKISKETNNTNQLKMWVDIIIILNDMIEIATIIDNRNNLSALFKKSLPILTLFISHGIPVIETLFETHTNDILIMFKNLQKATRFLQRLCCHSRLKKDTALTAKIPVMKGTLENLIYKVKALLVARNSSEAFSIGNLKNKNIHGEVISSQHSIDQQSTDDADEHLLADEEAEDQIMEELDTTDDEVMHPESRSVSDII